MFFPDQSNVQAAQQRFIDCLDNEVVCRVDNNWCLRSKSDALNYSYIINFNNSRRNYLGVDLDYENSGSAWQELSLLHPTLIIVHKNNTHANIFWELERPVYWANKYNRKKISIGAINFFKDVQKRYTICLEGDYAYTNVSVRNPFHSSVDSFWFNRQYTLHELSEYVPYLKKNHQGVSLYSGRNDELFNEGRRIAYRLFKHAKTDEEFENSVVSALQDYNKVIIPNNWPGKGSLSFREANSVIFSIVNWILINRNNELLLKQLSKNVGAMGLPKVNYLSYEHYKTLKKERQSLGAHHTNTLRTEQTLGRIKDIVDNLQANNKKVTRHAVSELSGLSLKTVSKYIKMLYNK